MRLITSLTVVLFSIVFANSGGPGGNYANNAPSYNNCTVCHSGNVNSGNGSVTITGIPDGGYVPGETYSLTLSVTGTHSRGYGFQMASQVGNNNAGTFSLGANSQNAELTGNRVQHSTRTISGEWIVEWLAPASDVGDVTFSFSGLATGGNSGYGGDDVYTGSVQVPAADVVITFQPQSKDELQIAVDLWESDNISALSTYGEINEWDVSLITDMSYLFQDKTTFNDDLNNWDVSNVTNMNRFFMNCNEFNGDISTWDVSNVSNMAWMFHRADQFNGDLSGWDVSSVTNMNAMFYQAYVFNSILSNWNVSNVVTTSMMFRESSFDQDISNWNVSNVVNGSMMFRESSFNQDISNWNVSSLDNPSGMFTDTPFNQDISGWDVSNATNMGDLFKGAINFNQDISGWDVSNATNIGHLFYGAINFDQDISSWDVSSALNMDMMFDNATNLSDENKCAIHTSFSANTNWPYDWSDLCSATTVFQPQSKQELVTAVDLWVSDNVTALSTYGEINEWDVSLISDMSGLFYGLNLFNEDISSWDVSYVYDMSHMFNGAQNFNNDISNWNVSSVTNMDEMFHAAASFNSDLSSWDVSQVISMDGVFAGATSFNQDISSWDVSSVINMNYLFWGAYDFNQDISGWNVSNVETMVEMFNGATIFNQDISSWNVSNVREMNNIFEGALAITDENKCAIHTSWSTNSNWPYDWSASCALTVNELSVSPEYFKLHQNYPNPFNPTTKIHYDLPKNSFVSIDIYDVIGNKIKSLVNSVQGAGYRAVYWDATNNLGQSVSAGMYIYTIQAGEFVQTRKMVLLK